MGYTKDGSDVRAAEKESSGQHTFSHWVLMKLHMIRDTERGRFVTLGEKLLDSFFLEKCGNTLIIRKTDVRKHVILSHFPIAKTPDSNSRSKHNSMRPILHDDQIPPEFFAQLTC